MMPMRRGHLIYKLQDSLELSDTPGRDMLYGMRHPLFR
jgi:hypothetical protein